MISPSPLVKTSAREDTTSSTDQSVSKLPALPRRCFSRWASPGRDLLHQPMDQLLCSGKVVVFGSKVAAIRVFVVDPGIGHCKNRAFAIFRRGHQDISPVLQHRNRGRFNRDGARVLHEKNMRMPKHWTIAGHRDPAGFMVVADHVMA